jgi:ubiquinone/menaquinone biosynthesis C-methylase UbiE
MAFHSTGRGGRGYLPAAGHDALLPFYDPLVTLLGGNPTRNTLIAQADLEPGQRVLDVGCGTGSLPILVKTLHAEVEVVAIDPDPRALARAERKARRAGVSVRFDLGFAEKLPYPSEEFDRVFSSFAFHHLPGEAQGEALREARRVLREGGALHVLEFSRFESRLLEQLRQAGFEDVRRVAQEALFFGHFRIAYYRGGLSA